VSQLADSGWRGAMQANPAVRAGLKIALGDAVHDAIADCCDLPLRPVEPIVGARRRPSTDGPSGSGAPQCRQRLQTLVLSPFSVT
jgi:hypothetical protein